MLSSCTALVGIFATILLPACSSNQPIGDSSWSVQLKTSGGFAGVGNGSILITSDGKIQYLPPSRPGKSSRPCEATLPSEELRAVAEAIRLSKPEGWDVAGLNVAAPDAFGYELELHTGDEKKFNVKWYDNTRERLPPDLKRLSEVVTHVMITAAKRCEAN